MNDTTFLGNFINTSPTSYFYPLLVYRIERHYLVENNKILRRKWWSIKKAPKLPKKLWADRIEKHTLLLGGRIERYTHLIDRQYWKITTTEGRIELINPRRIEFLTVVFLLSWKYKIMTFGVKIFKNI